MDWQPIESAPKDGEFFVYAPTVGGKRPYSAGNSNVAVMVRRPTLTLVDAHFQFDMEPPTHWMPLPAPPSGGNSQ
jgi:hypothetical protein